MADDKVDVKLNVNDTARRMKALTDVCEKHAPAVDGPLNERVAYAVALHVTLCMEVERLDLSYDDVQTASVAFLDACERVAASMPAKDG